jgi:hypothetical protein
MICIRSFYTKYIGVIYMTHYTLSIVISYKISYKDCLYGGNPGVSLPCLSRSLPTPIIEARFHWREFSRMVPFSPVFLVALPVPLAKFFQYDQLPIMNVLFILLLVYVSYPVTFRSPPFSESVLISSRRMSLPISCHHVFVTSFSSSNRSSSSINARSCDCLNKSSLKSRSNLIVSRPELRESATYKLKRLSVPDGGDKNVW